MRAIVLVFGLVVAMSSTSAQATLVYDIFFRHASFGDGLDTTFNATPGQVFNDVEAVVRETVTAPDISAFDGFNVNGFGIVVQAVGSDGSFTDKQTDVTNGAENFNPSPSRFSYFSFAGGRAAGPDLGGGVREFVLGTIDLVAPTTGSTTFSMLDENLQSGDIATVGGPGIGGLEAIATSGAFGTPSITLDAAAVPEPTSLLMLSSVIGIGAFGRRRRKSGQAKA